MVKREKKEGSLNTNCESDLVMLMSAASTQLNTGGLLK